MIMSIIIKTGQINLRRAGLVYLLNCMHLQAFFLVHVDLI